MRFIAAALVNILLGTVLPLLTIACDDQHMHPHFAPQRIAKRSTEEPKEHTLGYWAAAGQETLKQRLSLKLNQNVAKNVILFLGDGMSIPTISAARVYMGGEEQQLAFDKFPYTGLSKTYCIDRQVADSACTSTAYLGGVKANLGTIGVTGAVPRSDCTTMQNATNYVKSIVHYAQLAGKRTGLVTTARVTHASPAGVYAHTAERDWEADSDVIAAKADPAQCHDIAHQLIYGDTGRRLNVILGGGRANFIPLNETDPENVTGHRSDGVNLINEWIELKKLEGLSPHYIWNRKQLEKIQYNSTDYLLGLFNSDHISYNVKRKADQEPSLKEMTQAAIKVLDQSDNGYFLFVEGARIDMGHHEARAGMALDETVEFSKAVQAAVDMTDESETLIVVTSDHAHTMSFSGYAVRGGDILGVGGEGNDEIPYTILNYANGPGYRSMEKNGRRYDVSQDQDMSKMNYRYPGIFPMDMETHGGDDVAVFAHGPWAHLFTGVMEQNVIPQLMSYASCVGEGLTVCDFFKKESSFQRLMIYFDK